MMISNLSESEDIFKKSHNTCKILSDRGSRACINCRYRHKGICTGFFHEEIKNEINENSKHNYKKSTNNKLRIPEGRIKIMKDSKIRESEPILNLKDLFYEKKAFNNSIDKQVEIIPQKAKYDNFKLLTDISIVLQKCRHLTDKDKLLYCQSQRYFMKLYLREINKK